MNICWKLFNEERMLPPIHMEYFLSGGSNTLIFIVEGANAITSLCNLSVIPLNMVLPPAITMLAYRSLTLVIDFLPSWYRHHISISIRMLTHALPNIALFPTLMVKIRPLDTWITGFQALCRSHQASCARSPSESQRTISFQLRSRWQHSTNYWWVVLPSFPLYLWRYLFRSQECWRTPFPPLPSTLWGTQSNPFPPGWSSLWRAIEQTPRK